MQETRHDGSEKFTELFDPEKQIMDAVTNPDNKTVTIHKEGSRYVFGGSVYEFTDGKRKRIGLSWRNTTETIQEHKKKE